MKLVTHERPHSPKTTHDKVIPDFLNSLHRAPPCKDFYNFTLDQPPANGYERVSHHPDTDGYDKQGENSSLSA
jgi:hypothetical protein